ncbi:MAG: GMC family oxidoreductase [Candidatus Thiodiazotropha endolucinida]|nr:GMC family oxidoreductase [Candidatus Thiodiazotropha taylori]MCW4316746.1 GMC family oxidoreductase [Candidatus Thiodiazotropha taylori]
MIYDVAIVGAGIAGSLMAYRLANNGLNVVLIEAGYSGEERHKMIQRFAEAKYKIPSSPYNDGISYRNAPAPTVFNDSYYDQQGPNKFKSTYLRRTGGSTWHWLGNVPRFIPSDFKIKSNFDVGCDWPIGYDDLEPWYCEAEHEIGVSGNHEEWNCLHGGQRSQEYPMSAIALSYSDKILYEKLNNINIDGTTVTINSTPQARNSTYFDNRPSCLGSSSCVPICPYGAKYDASVHVKKAVDAGAELREKTIVTRIDGNLNGNSVNALHYQTWDGNSGEIKAKRYVLAAHSIESAKLLLMSDIGNSSGQVGCNLMDHLNGAAGAILPEPVYPFRGPPTTSGIDSFRDGDFRKDSAAFRMSMGNNAWGRMESPDATLDYLVRESGVFGAELRDKLNYRVTRMFRISYTTEMLPNPENRIVLSNHSDSTGLPRPQLHMRVDQYNLDAFAHARRVMTELFDKLGAVETKFMDDPNAYKGAGHIIGTCKMGDSPSESVVDAECRSHDMSNLFVVGASVFPTSGTANPTLTVAALALRASETIYEELQS